MMVGLDIADGEDGAAAIDIADWRIAVEREAPIRNESKTVKSALTPSQSFEQVRGLEKCDICNFYG